MIEKKENTESNPQKIKDFFSFLEDMPPFYRLSYKDILFIKQNSSLMPKHLLSNIDKTDEALAKLKKSYRLGNYHYKQTYANSCAIACYMMASSNYLKKQPFPSRELEKEILNKFDNDVSITKILKFCLNQNLNIKIFSESDYREIEFEKEWAEVLRKDFMDFYKNNSENPKTKFIFNQSLEKNLLTDLLMNGESIMVNELIHEIPHMRVISGYDEDTFVVSDPLEYRKSQMSFTTLNENSKPPLAQFFFSLTSKKTYDDGE